MKAYTIITMDKANPETKKNYDKRIKEKRQSAINSKTYCPLCGKKEKTIKKVVLGMHCETGVA